MACLAPELRFDGYTDAWEQHKLGDVVSDFYCGQTPYRQNELYWNGMVNWLASGDLNRDLVVETAEKITEYGKESTGLRVVPKGTVVIATMGQEAPLTRGNCGILDIDSTINQACMALFVDEGTVDNDFLFQWYKSVGDVYGLRYTQGTKQQNYNEETLGKLVIVLPNIEEQQQVGASLRCLDNLITLHQRECDKLVTTKQAMIQKMFPKPGEDMPEVRFGGFEGSWQHCTLGAIAKEINRKAESETNAPIMMISTPAGGFIYQSEHYAFDNTGDSLKNYTLLHEGELSYNHGASKMRPYGSCFVMHEKEARVPFVYHSFSVEGACSDFVSLYLNLDFMQNELSKIISSGARMDGLLNVSFAEYMTIPIMLPSIEEQREIAGLLACFDQLISLKSQELDKLKQVKSALLQKMFV